MQIFYTFMNEYLVKNHIFMNECLVKNHIFMNEYLSENYTFMNVMGALAGLGIPIKEALRGFCNKIVTRLKQRAERCSTQCVTHSRVRVSTFFRKRQCVLKIHKVSKLNTFLSKDRRLVA